MVEVDLSTRGVELPHQSVRMVIAQPYLTLNSVEPYRCEAQSKPQLLAAISETLKVARPAPHDAWKTHFTLFPEYSIPGLDGVNHVDEALNADEWPRETIVIGGTDGLSKEDFATLATAPNTNLDTTQNDLDRIADNHWINCCITWVKGTNGTVERWLQPKLHPAWREQDITCSYMYRGKSVFAFKGQFDSGIPYRFCTLVCFDWIAPREGQKPWRAVVDALSQQVSDSQAELSLSWLFVIQNNRRPSHPSFMTEVNSFFNQTIVRNVRRDRTCLVFANSAGNERPGRIGENGDTRILFAAQTLFRDPDCHPTFCNGGPRFGQNRVLAGHRDLLFREGGACIHSFEQVNPDSLIAGSPGSTIPLRNAFVHPIVSPTDPRTPAAPVAASVKWLNDELDDIVSLGARYSSAPLATEVNEIHCRTVGDLRAIPGQSINFSVKLATTDSDAQNADQWDRLERAAVHHLIHTLSIVGLSSEEFVVDGSSVHARLTIRGWNVDLIAVRGQTHEHCLKHFNKQLPIGRQLVVVVSRDPDNNPWLKRFGSILEPRVNDRTSERNITDPKSSVRQLGYRDLLDIFQHSCTIAEAREKLYAKLTE